MSGVKRRTAYRKAVTDAVSDTFPELGPMECVVRVVRSQGSNLFEVETSDGATGMCILPTKYRKLIWVKRGDFLIAHQAGDDVETATGARGSVNFRVEHVLGEPQVGFLQLKGLWPEAFGEVKVSKRAMDEADREIRSTAASAGGSAAAAPGKDDLLSSDDYDSMLRMKPGGNRRGARRADAEESSDEEEESSDEE